MTKQKRPEYYKYLKELDNKIFEFKDKYSNKKNIDTVQATNDYKYIYGVCQSLKNCGFIWVAEAIDRNMSIYLFQLTLNQKIEFYR